MDRGGDALGASPARTGAVGGPTRSALADVRVPLRLKLSALWAATMFLFAYGDIFTGYRSGVVEDLRHGELGGFEVNQASCWRRPSV